MSLSRAIKIVKSVQTGSAAPPAVGTPLDVVIGTVNPAKCLVNLTGPYSISTGNFTGGSAVTGANNLRLTATQSTSASGTINWSITEFF